MKLIQCTQAPKNYSSLRDIFDPAFANAGLESLFERKLVPPVDLREDSEKITVELELAGVKKEDFDISFENEVLTISGERKSAGEKVEGEFVRRERPDGPFSRSVRVASPIKSGEITANYAEGILTVVLPKAEEAKPKKIAVS